MRDYDPTTGRYLQSDPLGLIDGASVYGYARQSPMRWIDPRGEDAETFGPVLGVAAAYCLADGPLPIGEIIALGIIGYAAVEYMMSAPTDGTAVCDEICTESRFPPGFWPGDRGAEEWGRRTGIGPREGRRIFHDLKQETLGSGGADDYGVDPETGDVIDQNGELIGNLNDEN